MSIRLHIGAKSLRGKLEAYAKRFDLLEVLADSEAPPIAALKRWRKAVPPHFDFAVVSGPALSRLRPGAELDADLARLVAMRDALQARVVLLSTPPEVTPSALSRQRLADVIARLPHDASHLVWEPHGLWETEQAASVARARGVVLSVDAAREIVPPGPIAYVRLRALGETRSFGPAALGRVLDAIGERREAYVVLETTSALEECKRLRQLAQRPSGFRGGQGRVVRPRAPKIKVRDDEQE